MIKLKNLLNEGKNDLIQFEFSNKDDANKMHRALKKAKFYRAGLGVSKSDEVGAYLYDERRNLIQITINPKLATKIINKLNIPHTKKSYQLQRYGSPHNHGGYFD